MCRHGRGGKESDGDIIDGDEAPIIAALKGSVEAWPWKGINGPEWVSESPSRVRAAISALTGPT